MCSLMMRAVHKTIWGKRRIRKEDRNSGTLRCEKSLIPGSGIFEMVWRLWLRITRHSWSPGWMFGAVLTRNLNSMSVRAFDSRAWSFITFSSNALDVCMVIVRDTDEKSRKHENIIKDK